MKGSDPQAVRRVLPREGTVTSAAGVQGDTAAGQAASLRRGSFRGSRLRVP